MGKIIKLYEFENANNLMQPVIFCKVSKELRELAKPINYGLARELIQYANTMQRTRRMEQAFLKQLETLGDNPIISELDILFNPNYQIDALRLLTNACKKKKFSVLWPGKYENGKLYYAEEGYKDYKSYEVANYDITVIV